MQDKKRYQVFVSSTFMGLQEERKIVKNALLEMGCIPSAMEEFPAIDVQQFEYIKKQIDECDYYILILGGYIGTVTAEATRGYTYKEYEYALRKGIPVLAVIRKEDGKTVCKEKENDKIEIYNKFLDEVQSNRLCRFFEDKYELSGIVHYSMRKQIDIYPRAGWSKNEKYERFEDELIFRGNIYEEVHFGSEIASLEKKCYYFASEDSWGDTISLYYGKATQMGVDIVIKYGENAYNLANDIDSDFYMEGDILKEDIKLQVSIVRFGESDKMLVFTFGIPNHDIKSYVYLFDRYGLKKVDNCIASQNYQILENVFIYTPYGSQGLYDTYVYCEKDIMKLEKQDLQST